MNIKKEIRNKAFKHLDIVTVLFVVVDKNYFFV